MFEAKALCHPAGINGRDGVFVPNDIRLGGAGAPPFMLLTGPNMGGKSTLLRQVSLGAIMAQVLPPLPRPPPCPPACPPACLPARLPAWLATAGTGSARRTRQVNACD